MKKIFHSVKKLWMAFANLLGRISTFILLTLVYVFAVGLMSLFTRIFRQDLLERKLQSERASYWRTRASSDRTLERHKFQF